MDLRRGAERWLSHGTLPENHTNDLRHRDRNLGWHPLDVDLRQPDGVNPSLHVEHKSSHIKQYFKEDRALRTETTINNTHDFLCRAPVDAHVIAVKIS